MRKITLFAFVAIVLMFATSCYPESFYDYVNTDVSNIGTITSSTDAGKTTVSIAFSKTGTTQSTNKSEKTVYCTNDTGRYYSLIKAYDDFSLVESKKYVCSVSSDSTVKYLVKEGDSFFFYGDSTKKSIDKKSIYTFIDSECVVTISFGGETIINYANLPVSPIGLAAGTLWNDNGTIRIVM